MLVIWWKWETWKSGAFRIVMRQMRPFMQEPITARLI